MSYAQTAPIADIIERLEVGGIEPLKAALEARIRMHADPKSSGEERAKADFTARCRIHEFGYFYEHVERLIAEYHKAKGGNDHA